MSDAVLAIAAELSVEAVLQRLVDAARELAGARYAALGMPDGDGAFEQFDVVVISDVGANTFQLAPRTFNRSQPSPDKAELVRRRVEAGADPSSVVFLERFAIVRNAGSADLTWVDLTDPTKSNNLPLGSHPAAAIALAGDGASVHATLPQEQQVATLHVMMGRPMVMDGIKNTIGADVTAGVANRLDAIGPRRLEQRTVFERPGRYHLELRLPDGSRAEFELPVARTGPAPVRVLPELHRMRATPGQRVRVRFRVVGPMPNDAQVLAFSTSSGAIHQIRAPARPVGAGVLEAFITPPAAGSYRLSLHSESQNLASDARSGAALRVATGSRRRGG
jgi:hypothetical protein